jgi:putative ABC transport system ATP-binding protein
VDAGNEALLMTLLRSRADAGRSVVVVTHSARVAAAADRVIQLSDGRIVGG